MAKVINAIEEQRYVLPVRLTVSEYLQKEWLPAIEATVRETTYRSYAAHVAYHIAPGLGSTQLQRLNGAMLNAFYSKLASEGRVRGEGGLSPGTVRRVHATLHRALRDAVRWNRLSVNPAAAADPPNLRPRGNDCRPGAPSSSSASLRVSGTTVSTALWHLLAMTGCRRGEALGLCWEKVDLEGGRVTIDTALLEVGGRAEAL